jgi:hypothetical protein
MRSTPPPTPEISDDPLPKCLARIRRNLAKLRYREERSEAHAIDSRNARTHQPWIRLF